MKNNCFIPFSASYQKEKRPELFTFPFYYRPHALSIVAAEHLQQRLEDWTDLQHNFGLGRQEELLTIGKMFGVLVAEDTEGQLGYLFAFSGKLADQNHHEGFVPPVFDMLEEQGFFKVEEVQLNQLNAQIEELQNSEAYQQAQEELKQAEEQSQTEIQAAKRQQKEQKKKRDLLRAEWQDAAGALSESQTTQLKNESIHYSYAVKKTQKRWKEEIENRKQKVDAIRSEIEALKQERKQRSNTLQNQLFDQYFFWNAQKEKRSVLSIFEKDWGVRPPAGAGECAAPKLLQYAYLNDLKPLALAEFWWGASPKSEVRKHKQFYPSCRTKCEPILGFMMQGLQVEPNPMLTNPAEGKSLEYLYEDEDVIVVNKPAEFLSVPGKNISDSVYQRIIDEKIVEGPVIVHRLDMSTSGLMVIAKNKKAHKRLQAQFIDKTVEKRYNALLDGEIAGEGGEIELPLRVDLDNRPQQLVDEVYGKYALTHWEKLREINGRTLVQFKPITGRTHQLRVHSAHQRGLNTAIVGDDLYGQKESRLHLQSAYLKFVHPRTHREMIFQLEPDFL